MIIKEVKVNPIIYGLPNEKYHNGEPYNQYLSSTSLKDYMVSPKFFKYKKEHPLDFGISDDASEKGSLYHAYMESMVNFGDNSHWLDDYFVFDAPINERTGKPFGRDSAKYIEAFEEAKSENGNKQPISQQNIDLVKNMADQLFNNCRETSSQIKTIIKQGKAEVSHFVEYNGCKFKYRPDVETKKKIIDWKTVAADDLHEDSVIRIINKFHYGISAAFYQFFEHEQSGVWKNFYWVMQQKDAPYDAVLVSAENYGYSWDGSILTLGSSALEFEKLRDQHIYCSTNNDWDGAQVFIQPGWHGHRIMSAEAPSYTGKQYNFYNNRK
jgi:hypothetical protein